MTDGIKASKNSAKISNKVLKAECELALHYRIPGSQKHEGNALLTDCSPHASQGAYKKTWGNARDWRGPLSGSRPGGEEKQPL